MLNRVVCKTSMFSCRILIFFLIVVVLYGFSLDHIRKDRNYTALSSGNLDTLRYFYQTARKRLVEGTYHLTYTDNYYKQIRTTIFKNLDAKLATYETEWKTSKSYKDFETNCSRLRFLFDPLIPYLIPQDNYQQNILSNYDSIKPTNINSCKVGYVEEDYYPEKGSIDFTRSGGVALDLNNRSIGVDLGEVKSIVAIRLYSWAEKYRIKSSNLSLWTSNDNKVYYQYHGKSYTNLNSSNIILDGLDINNRYVKVHCNLTDNHYTFVADLKSILTVFAPPQFRQ